MDILTEILPLRATIQGLKKQSLSIALVPTMGNLHAGHLSLVKKAQQSADRVLVSIFVNPLQFGVNEDFATYPRSLQSDIDKLNELGVNFIFSPQTSLMYPQIDHYNTRVSVQGLSAELCGVTRPHFFDGVTTVLTKLFSLVQPNVAIFGEKDYQQLIIVQRMVKDLNLSIKIIGMPIVRETDGLAMSSRNQYLTPNERAIASQLNIALCALKKNILNNLKKIAERSDNNIPDTFVSAAIQHLNQSGFKVDYLELRNTHDLTPIRTSDLKTKNREFILLVAAYLGKTRLLDNIKFSI